MANQCNRLLRPLIRRGTSVRCHHPVRRLAIVAIVCGSGPWAVWGCASNSQTSDNEGGAPAGNDGSADHGSDGSGGGPTDAIPDISPPSIDPSTMFPSLSDAQKGELCDWMNAELGGYGMEYTCGGGTYPTYANQAACIHGIFSSTCTTTVGQFEACVRALAPEHGCNLEYATCSPVYDCNPRD